MGYESQLGKRIGRRDLIAGLVSAGILLKSKDAFAQSRECSVGVSTPNDSDYKPSITVRAMGGKEEVINESRRSLTLSTDSPVNINGTPNAQLVINDHNLSTTETVNVPCNTNYEIPKKVVIKKEPGPDYTWPGCIAAAALILGGTIFLSRRERIRAQGYGGYSIRSMLPWILFGGWGTTVEETTIVEHSDDIDPHAPHTVEDDVFHNVDDVDHHDEGSD